MSDNQSMIQNTMSGTNFKFVLHKSDTKVFNWMVQNPSLPAISISTAKATSSPKVGTWNLAGTAINFEPLVVRILMDENIAAWQEIYAWIKELVEPYDGMPTNLYGQAESTASLHVLTNNHSSLGKVFTFHRLFPVKLGGIEFDSTSPDANILHCDVVFMYDTYDLEIDAGKII